MNNGKRASDLTLVERAKRVPIKSWYVSDRKFNKQEIDLAIAWSKGEVTIGAIGKITKRQNVSVYLWLAQALREYVRQQKK